MKAFSTRQLMRLATTSVLAASFLLVLIGPGAVLAQEPVDLMTAGNFVILSKSGITDVPVSMIDGNIGTSPTTGANITGVSCAEVAGIIYTVDAAGPLCRVVNAGLLTQAVNDMMAAYTDAAGRAPTQPTELGGGNISGMTLAPGVYKWSTTVLINSNLTLSGGPSDVWIFEIAGDLNVASGGVFTGVKVLLTGGAQASNVFWQVGGGVGATLGTYSTFNGTILSAKQVVIQTGATVCGRALAQSLVTLDQNNISDLCEAACGLNVAITPSGPTTICVNDSVGLSATGAVTYSWSPGTGLNVTNGATVTASPTTTTVYTVTGTDTNGCQNTTRQTVTVGPNIYCPGNIITGTDAGQCGAVVNWAPPVITNNCPGVTVVCVPPSGSLFPQGTANVNCTATDSSSNQATCAFSVTVTQPSACSIQVSGNAGGLTICQGNTVVLTAANGMKSYLWSGPEQNGVTVKTIVVGTPGTYSCTEAQYYGPTTCCSVTLVVNLPPDCTIAGNLFITNGLPTTLVGPSGLVSQYWTGPQNNGLSSQSNIVIDPGTYTLHVTDSNGCQNACYVTVSNRTPQACSITASGDAGGLTICQGRKTTLTGANGMVSYLWSGPEQNGATTKFIIVGTAGTYTVTQIDHLGLTNNCSVYLNVNPLPAVYIHGNRTICQGSTTTLCGPPGLSNYLWLGPQNNGLEAQSNTVSFAGTYTLTVTDGNGCQNAISVPVTVINCPPP